MKKLLLLSILTVSAGLSASSIIDTDMTRLGNYFVSAACYNAAVAAVAAFAKTGGPATMQEAAAYARFIKLDKAATAACQDRPNAYQDYFRQNAPMVRGL